MSQAASRGMRAENVPSGTRDGAAQESNGQRQNIALKSVFQPVLKEMAAVEELLKSELHSETPWVNRLLEHNWLKGGKRIRPLFLLLSGACSGQLTERHTKLAAAIEMIHAATLVHDDVLDKAETRRHQPTVNAKWGNRISVLLGDYLFTHAFYLASSAMSAEAVQMMAVSSNRVCEGEMRQNAWQGNFELSEKDYLEMIADKTAALCGSSCRIGAFLSGATESEVEQYAVYGKNLGVAFQIIDDILDLVGSQDKVGKTLGTDLLNQKPTLPIIHALKSLPANDRQELVDRLQSESSCVDDVLPLLKQTDSIEYARSKAQDHANNAVQFANSVLESGPEERAHYAEALKRLAEFVLQRMH